MVSIWWVLVAFIIGGYAGALLVGLMSMAARNEERRFEGRPLRHSRGELNRRHRSEVPVAVRS